MTPGYANGVGLAPGPDGRANGSYEFKGTSDSYIEIANSAGDALDVHHSMTMLCWLYFGGQNGPFFHYGTNNDSGVHFWVYDEKLHARFMQRNYSLTTALSHTTLTDDWKFVGASYNSVSGNATLFVDGDVVQTVNIGAGLELATQDKVIMGRKIGDNRYFKGRIAQMQVYNLALTQEQIETIQKSAG